MKKQHYITITLLVLLYIMILIIKESISNYSENQKILEKEKENILLEKENKQKESDIKYLSTESYKIKETKENIWYKFSEEKTFQITKEDKIANLIKKEEEKEIIINQQSKYDNLEVYEKWIEVIKKKS